jgi:hypothetical protein
MGINMKGLRPSHHIESGQQSEQSEAMVTMQMRYENGIETGCLEVHLTHSQLYAFATINEERLVTQVQNLP